MRDCSEKMARDSFFFSVTLFLCESFRKRNNLYVRFDMHLKKNLLQMDS
jgi:hypothetical protein